MPYDPDKHRRRSIRVQGYDYASPGGYFITICVQHGLCLFGEVIDGVMHPNDAGRMVEATWASLSEQFDHLELDVVQVMPNHLHGILVLLDNWDDSASDDRDLGKPVRGDHKDRPYDVDIQKQGARWGEPRVRPTHPDGEPRVRPTDGKTHIRPSGTLPGTVGRIMQAFKSATTNAYIYEVHQQGWSSFHRKLWQRNYWERIIRDGDELDRIRHYIAENPLRWHFDRLNPSNDQLS